MLAHAVFEAYPGSMVMRARSKGCPVKDDGVMLRPACATCSGRKTGQIRTCRGQFLSNEGDEAQFAFAVVEGTFKELRTMEDGRTQVFRILEPGDFANIESLIGYTAYAATVEALSDGLVCPVRREEVEQGATSAEIALRRALIRQICAQNEHLFCLGLRNPEERVMEHLKMVLKDRPTGTWVRMPLDRQDLADYLNLSVGTVSRVLHKFVLEQKVQISGRKICALTDEFLSSVSSS